MPYEKLAELKTQYIALEETTRPAVVAALGDIQRDNANALACVARIRVESIRCSNELRESEPLTDFDLFHNLESHLKDHADLQARRKRYIATLDGWDQRFVEAEQPELERREHLANIDVLKVDWDLADLRVRMAQAQLRENTELIDQQHGGVFIHSNLVDSLQQDLATASRQYFGALDAYRDLVKRQDARRAAIANVGMVTTKQISNTIPRY